MINMYNYMQRGTVFSACLLLVLLHISNAQAAIFSFISSATKLDETCVKYKYTIQQWTESGDSVANPCYNNYDCILGVSHRHFDDGTSDHWADGGDAVFNRIHIEGFKTIGDIRKAVIKDHQIPLSGEDRHCGGVKIAECVGLFYSPYGDDRFHLLPTSVCGIAPPPTGHCQFSARDVKLDYGSVSPETLNGKQISAAVTVSCDASMNLEAWLINPQDGTDTVPLRTDGSLSARLTLDGESAAATGKAFSVASGGSQTLTVTSEAVVSGTPEAGEFSGSAVLFLSVP